MTMTQQRSDSDLWEARELFLAVMNNLPKVVVKYDDCLAQPNCTTEDGYSFTFRFYAGSIWQDLVYEADRPLLLWLLRESLKWGSPKVTWVMLLRFLDPNPTEEHKWRLYESALRIASTSVQVHYQQQVPKVKASERKKQTFVFARRSKLAKTKGGEPREETSVEESSQTSEPLFCKQISFELEPDLLFGAEWAFNRHSLRFEGSSKPSS